MWSQYVWLLKIHRLLEKPVTKIVKTVRESPPSKSQVSLGQIGHHFPSCFRKFLIRIQKRAAENNPLKIFKRFCSFLLLQGGRNRSSAGPFWWSQLFCLAGENRKAALSDGFLAAFKNHLKRL
jgi:hypothetical protein